MYTFGYACGEDDITTIKAMKELSLKRNSFYRLVRRYESKSQTDSGTNANGKL